MNRYRQLTSEERHTLSTLRKQGYHQAAIARSHHATPLLSHRPKLKVVSLDLCKSG